MYQSDDDHGKAQALVLEIHVAWHGPCTLEHALRLNSPTDYGLYQYYGDHPVYGNGVLLYVGKASKQSFGRRLSQHNWHQWVSSPVELYVGRLCGESAIDVNEWERRIDLAERLIVFSHRPAFNAANLNRIGAPPGEDVRVLNWGRRKSLLPEVSLSRWEGGWTLGHDVPADLHPYTTD